jgi:hypothetical protein
VISSYRGSLRVPRVADPSAHIRHRLLRRQRRIPRSSRRRCSEAPAQPRESPQRSSQRACSRRESPPIPAQPGSAMTGLSRRRSRVRVPSLPSFKVPANGHFAFSDKAQSAKLRAANGQHSSEAADEPHVTKYLQIAGSCWQLCNRGRRKDWRSESPRPRRQPTTSGQLSRTKRVEKTGLSNQAGVALFSIENDLIHG